MGVDKGAVDVALGGAGVLGLGAGDGTGLGLRVESGVGLADIASGVGDGDVGEVDGVDAGSAEHALKTRVAQIARNVVCFIVATMSGAEA